MNGRASASGCPPVLYSKAIPQQSGRALCGTNVVVSGILTGSPDAPTRIILDAMLAGTIRFVLSVDSLAEYREALLRPAITRRHGLDASLVDKLLARLAVGAIVHDEDTAGSATAVDNPDPVEDITAVGKPTAFVRDSGYAHVARLASSLPNVVLVTGDNGLSEDLASTCGVMSPAEYVSGSSQAG